jgi:hypothetical protein
MDSKASCSCMYVLNEHNMIHELEKELGCKSDFQVTFRLVNMAKIKLRM